MLAALRFGLFTTSLLCLVGFPTLGNSNEVNDDLFGGIIEKRQKIYAINSRSKLIRQLVCKAETGYSVTGSHDTSSLDKSKYGLRKNRNRFSTYIIKFYNPIRQDKFHGSYNVQIDASDKRGKEFSYKCLQNPLMKGHSDKGIGLYPFSCTKANPRRQFTFYPIENFFFESIFDQFSGNILSPLSEGAEEYDHTSTLKVSIGTCEDL